MCVAMSPMAPEHATRECVRSRRVNPGMRTATSWCRMVRLSFSISASLPPSLPPSLSPPPFHSSLSLFPLAVVQLIVNAPFALERECRLRDGARLGVQLRGVWSRLHSGQSEPVSGLWSRSFWVSVLPRVQHRLLGATSSCNSELNLAGQSCRRM